jgi:hypothetical protein
LVVAIEKLSDANERSDGPSRSFYRRLCLGGVIASRLLSEGVLEQDRRTRHQFRRCIEPMFGSIDVELLESLTKVTAVESLNWLVDIAADAINEQTENESIGAAYVLCVLMPDDHPRAPEVIANFTARSREYLNCLFDMLYQRYHFVDLDGAAALVLPFWVICLLMQLLASYDWRGLGKDGLRTIFVLMRTRRNLVFEAAELAGFDRTLCKIIAAVIIGATDEDDTVAQHSVNERFFDTSFFGPPKGLHLEDWTDAEWSALDKATGIFTLLKPILTFAYQKGAIEDALGMLENNRAFLMSFPESLAAFLPLALQDNEPFEATSERDGPIEPHWLYRPGYRRRILLRSTSDHLGFLRAHPAFAFHSLDWRFGDEEYGKFIRSPEAMNLLMEFYLLRPDRLRLSVALWGELVEFAETVGKNIRPALLVASKLEGHFEAGGRSFAPFLLKLPEEAAMLPLVMGTLPSSNHWRARKKSPTVGEIVETLAPNVKLLIDIVVTESQSSSVRGAAAMMALLHPKCMGEEIAGLIDAVVCCYEPRRDHWYLQAAGDALDAGIRTEDRRAVEGIGMLLRAGMGDFQGRAGLNSAFERWRQISKAPVQKRGIELFKS